MNRLISYLNRPASFNTKPWVIIIVASLLVCFLLGFFQPFGINKFDPDTKLYVVMGYTLITAIATSLVGYLFPHIFKKFYNQSNWIIGKSLLNNMLIISLIALGNSIFDWGLRHHLSATFGSIFLSYIIVTLSIGIIPALISIFIVQNYALKKNLNDAKVINSKLIERLKDIVPKNIEIKAITLSGNTKDTITVYSDCILYIESIGNYININYLSDGVVKQKQIRNTISQVVIELKEYPYLVRSHRAYIVNTTYITNIEGNSQGLHLSLKYLKDQIPVSRSYTKEFKNKL